jgi:LysR family transcriptional regulator of gallate degradation
MDRSDFPDLKKLRTFDAAARLGSLVAAAQELRISQPAVTYLIGRLETEIGVRLLDRDPNGSHLNTKGRAFAGRARRFLDLLRTAVEDCVGRSSADRRLTAICDRMTQTQCRSMTALWRADDLRSAALHLRVNRQAIVRAVRSLETLMDVVLVEPTPAGPSLNAQGREFSRKLTLAAQEIAAGLQIIGSDRALGTHGLRVGALVLSPRLPLAEAIHACAGSDPRQSIEIVEGAYEELAVLLRSGSIDVIFGALRDPPPFADLTESRLYEDPYVIACRRGHPLTAHKRI